MPELAIATFVFALVVPMKYCHIGAISSAPKKAKLIISFFVGLICAGATLLILQQVGVA